MRDLPSSRGHPALCAPFIRTRIAWLADSGAPRNPFPSHVSVYRPRAAYAGDLDVLTPDPHDVEHVPVVGRVSAVEVNFRLFRLQDRQGLGVVPILRAQRR